MDRGGFGDPSMPSGSPLAESGLYWGKVLRNDDPDRLGRIRATVPGIVDNTPWASPVGFPGAGYPGRGGYTPPPVGANVLIAFILGDVDEPVYWSGPPRLGTDGKPAPPSKVLEKSQADAPNVQVISQTENFEAYICDTDDEKRLVFKKASGDGDGSSDEEGEIVSINLIDGSIRLKATHYLKLEAPSMEIDAVKFKIGKRVVNMVTDSTI